MAALAAEATPVVGTDLCIARQPIFGPDREIVAYELLFRFGDGMEFPGVDGTLATSTVISTALQSMWSPALTGRNPVFINATRQLVVGGYFQLLPPEGTVIEILDERPDLELRLACSRLRTLGYRIAMDGLTRLGLGAELLPVADIIKVDFLRSDTAQRREILSCKPPQAHLHAARLETTEALHEARTMGCSYFQGFALCRPEIVREKKIPTNKYGCLRALKVSQREDTGLKELTRVVKNDLALSVQLLRYLNSPVFGFSRQIDTIAQGLVVLGLEPARRWVSLTALAGMVGTGSDVPLRRALVRARHAELLALEVGDKELAADLFMTGMLSTLDDVLGLEMDDLLAQLPLSRLLVDTLRGRATTLSPIFNYVVAYENADWDQCQVGETMLGLPFDGVFRLYRTAVEYVEVAFT